MRLTSLSVLGLFSWTNALDIPSFAPPSFPPSTIDNDGTLQCHYDVRKTMAFVNPDKTSANNWYFLYWITTTEGKKYHYTINTGLVGTDSFAGIVTFEDLNKATFLGGTNDGPASGHPGYLDVKSPTQHLTSPKGGDNYTSMHLRLDYPGAVANVEMAPTGKNFYLGGSGGLSFPTMPGQPGESEYQTVVPGFQWYWANPTLKLKGNITVDNRVLEIDPKESFGFMERIWGHFGLVQGSTVFWFYLSNGLVIQCQLIPGLPGGRKSQVATVWHPNGVHEAVPIDEINGWAPWRSPDTGISYSSKFNISISAKDSTLKVEKLSAASEAVNKTGVVVTSDAYVQGKGSWKANPSRYSATWSRFPVRVARLEFREPCCTDDG